MIKPSNRLALVCIFLILVVFNSCNPSQSPIDPLSISDKNQMYIMPDSNVQSRWISAENPSGEKGQGGMTNKGAKGNAFYILNPGEKKVIFDVKGAGIINRMWFSGSIPLSSEMLRAVRIDMYWDGSAKPAVSAPIGDFFGVAHGLAAKYDTELFSSPEGRSFIFTIPMPFHKSGLMTITNETSHELWLWYDINYQIINKIPDHALYFHAFWNRKLKTTLGEDYEILPAVQGRGRYLGTNIGVIGDPMLAGTWFGEGEVKVYLDGDKQYPTLVGTGTEDYIGSGWGQGEFVTRYSGSLLSDKTNDVYSFYRFHIPDPVYFHEDCRVTIHQMGNADKKTLLKLKQQGAKFMPVWYIGRDQKPTYQGRLLGEQSGRSIEDLDFPDVNINFYRSDDVCATAYFYLDKPSSDLPELPSVDVRLKNLKPRVWDRILKQN
jgi:hypothetical protein